MNTTRTFKIDLRDAGFRRDDSDDDAAVGIVCASVWEERGRVAPSVKKRGHFCAVCIENASFYQDRLGTNIGKTRNKSGVSLERSGAACEGAAPHHGAAEVPPRAGSAGCCRNCSACW